MTESTYNLQSQAYQKILDKILRNEYLPGQKISQKNLESDLEMGRTPIREALLRLRRDRLIYSVPQSGTFVTKIDLDAASNARFIRESLERKIVAEAAQLPNNFMITQAHDSLILQERYAKNGEFNLFFDADETFHRSFYLATDHAQVWTWLQTINIQFNRFRWLRLSVSELPWQTLIDQHRDILTAVENHNADQAEALTAKHLHMMEKEELSVIATFPEYFDNLPDSLEH